MTNVLYSDYRYAVAMQWSLSLTHSMSPPTYICIGPQLAFCDAFRVKSLQAVLHVCPVVP